jgi:hypothetical protein
MVRTIKTCAGQLPAVLFLLTEHSLTVTSKNDKKLWKAIQKITEHPLKKGNSFLE